MLIGSQRKFLMVCWWVATPNSCFFRRNCKIWFFRRVNILEKEGELNIYSEMNLDLKLLFSTLRRLKKLIIY